MKRVLLIISCLVLAACVSESENMQLPPPEGLPRETPPPLAPVPEEKGMRITELRDMLGLSRDPQDLGFEEKSYDGCQFGMREDRGPCGRRYLSVVHFRLLCRDSVETVQNVSTNFTPLVTSQMEWRLAGAQGNTRTDIQGFGQVLAISSRTAKAQRFMLILGTHSLGVEAAEVSQIIVPSNWCMGYSGLSFVPNYVAATPTK